MEPVRPKVDAYVLDWILHETLTRDWFFEQRDGNCRLMAPFVGRLSETDVLNGCSLGSLLQPKRQANMNCGAIHGFRIDHNRSIHQSNPFAHTDEA